MDAGHQILLSWCDLDLLVLLRLDHFGLRLARPFGLLGF